MPTNPVKFVALILMICLGCNNPHGTEEDSSPVKNDSAKVPSSQQDSTKGLPLMIKETAEIMKILKIKKRVNVPKDGKLSYKYGEPNIEGTLNFAFGALKEDRINDHTSQCYYLHPVIAISLLADSILLKWKDTTFIVYMACLSNLHHEVAHYLQETWTLNTYKPRSYAASEFEKYISMPDEFEAWSVGAYYFLKNTDSVLLKKLMAVKEDSVHKRKSLIRTFYKIYFPKKEQIFQ